MCVSVKNVLCRLQRAAATRREARFQPSIILHTIHLTHCVPVGSRLSRFTAVMAFFNQQLEGSSDDKIMACRALSLCFFWGVQAFFIF